ncbi:MAG: ribulose-phosphate 3-epimerase [Treponemataceae bacterium]|nr:ribulose-phosphate 3-epimerase [Treponemataceae bacterium]
MKTVSLAPSILATDFSDLKSSVKYIEENGGSWVHIDVMDGSFVPPITLGQQAVASIRPLTDLTLDVHLMTEHPDTFVDSFAEAGADCITFHYEAAVHHHRIVSRIHELGKKAGISIVPSTPVSAIQELLPFVDIVLVMTVNPGYGGQKLIPQCVDKIAQLDSIRRNQGFGYTISVDGGINQNTVSDVVKAGVDVVVSGSAFFSGKLTADSCRL